MRTWSNSSLTTLQVCGHKWYLRYIKKDWRPVGYAAKRGSAVHHVAKETHKRQMVESKLWDGPSPEVTELPGSPKSVQEARDLAATQFEKELTRGGAILTDKEKKDGQTHDDVKASSKDAAVDLAALYVYEVAPPVKPKAVERKVEITPKNMDIKIQGYIDLVEDDLGDVIRDLKTSEKAPWKDAAKVSQQLTMYNMIRYAETKEMPRESRLVHLVRTPKNHDTSVVVQSTTRDMGDIKSLVARIKVAVDAVDKGVFVPADPAAAGSPCGWCEFNDGTCPYYRKRSDEE
jgi:PD-(D/E)XK nuclease superfamily